MSKARSGGLDIEAARGVLLFSKTAAISAIPLFLDAHAGSLKVIPVNLKGNLDMGKRLEAQFKKKKKKGTFCYSILGFRQAQTLVDSAEVDVKVKMRVHEERL